MKLPFAIVMADDDKDDQLLAIDAFESAKLTNELHTVDDGVELLKFLRREGEYADAPRPGLVLLDLNMPRMDGREALMQIKADPDLRRIPVVVLTTSKAEADLVRSYDLGAASFITKPVTFPGLVEVVRSLGRYWLEIVEVPP